MLKSKRYRSPRPKGDWFNEGRKPHFDGTLTRLKAELLVQDVKAVASHQFLPLISFMKVERRFRTGSNGKPRAKLKKRQLSYASNKDGYIYSYYAEILNGYYEAYLKAADLNDVVVGYRAGRSNISISRAAFDEIEIKGNCTAIAYDIRAFFDNIDHAVLKNAWKLILGKTSLPPDHFNVFSALTRCRSVDRSQCLVRLGIDPKLKNRELPSPLCNSETFRQLICADSPAYPKLLSGERSRGIPQGTPISAVAANISMIDFDNSMNKMLLNIGGSYRRYSDDILIICPTDCAEVVEAATKTNLLNSTKTLRLSLEKTLRVNFLGRNTPVAGRPLQYLGFTFDGRKRMIRSGTLARFYARMSRGVAWTKWQHHLVERGKIAGRDKMHRRELYARFLHLGKKTFVTGYGKLARTNIGGECGIRRQFGRHQRVLNSFIERQK